MLHQHLFESDPTLYELISLETERQCLELELIASENYVSRSVAECMGSCLTNKYSEGYPGRRYYGGNTVIDRIESLCQQRALAAFSLKESEWGVNVQPYSGSPANFAVYTALLQPNEKIMGLYLPDGGHLTHGFCTAKRKISATSIFWESIPYRLNPTTHLIDYDEIQKLATEHCPKIIIAGFSCYTRSLDFARFRQIADSVGAILMADIAHVAGLIISDLYPSPFPHAHIVTTTTHKTLRGPRSGMIFFQKSPGPNGENFEEKINWAIFPGLQGGPHNNVISAVATCLQQAQTPEFRIYSQKVIDNARIMADFFIEKNYVLVTGGTDNHIIFINVEKSIGLNGEQAEDILAAVGISINKNACPGDKSVLRPSGIRIGTPALTSRGFDQQDFLKVSNIIHHALSIGVDILRAYRELTSKTNPTREEFSLYFSQEPFTFPLTDLYQDVHALGASKPLPDYSIASIGDRLEPKICNSSTNGFI